MSEQPKGLQLSLRLDVILIILALLGFLVFIAGYYLGTKSLNLPPAPPVNNNMELAHLTKG